MRPGIATPRWRVAWSTRASTTSSTRPATTRACSRRYIRNRVATWSLRERPARSRPPTSAPARSMSPRSRAECTSSSPSSGVKAPDSTSARSRSRASSIAASVVSSSRPAPCSTRACAREPARSCSASLQSKWVDFDSAARASAGPPAKRPPHKAVLRTVGSVTGGPFGCRTAGARRPRRCAAAPAVTTMMVSSPAMVPSTPSSPAWSSAEARKFAAPGGVRRMTRLAECSAETSSSWQRACSRVPRSSPSGAARTVRSPPSPGTAYTRFLPTRTRSAPTSTRSRESVAWVTSMPSVGEVVEQLGLGAHRGRREDLDDPLLPGGARGGDGHRASPVACCSTSHDSSAFCACSRFSASCQTRDAGPSITSASTSWPR